MLTAADLDRWLAMAAAVVHRGRAVRHAGPFWRKAA